MSNSKKKLSVKELIQAGAFAAIFLVVFLAVVMVCGFIPITYLLSGVFEGIILGPIFILYVTKVPKRGAILILSVFVGLLESTSTIYPLLLAVLLGVLAELIAGSNHDRSAKKYVLSYGVFACTYIGPFICLIFAKEQFIQSVLQYYGSDYAAKFSSLLPNWLVPALFLSDFAAGLIGGVVGRKMLKKHFERAGIV